MEVHISKSLNKLNHPTTTTTTDDGGMPDWLLFELLLRLPLNRVFSCRLVSKQWLSIASDPHFIRAYASRAPSLPQPYWTILPRYAPCRSISGFKPRDDSGRYTVVGVSDGLALYYSCRYTRPGFSCYDFYLCNPITGQGIKACELNPPCSYVRDGWGFLTRVDREFVLRSYRVVRAGAGPAPDAVTFEVYYSETDEWKTFTATLPHEPDLLELQATGAALNGILHWAEFTLGVIAYDPEANRMRVIPHPRSVARHHDKLCLGQCVDYRGELRYIGGYSGRIDEFPGFGIWRRVGDYYGDDGEWCIQHKIESKDVVLSRAVKAAHDPITLDGLFLDPCDSDVVYYAASGPFGRRFIFSYSLTSGRFDNRPEMVVNEENRTLTWTLPLVVPPWPTRVEEKLLDRRGADAKRNLQMYAAALSSEPHERENWTTFKAALGVGLGLWPYTSEIQSPGAVLDGSCIGRIVKAGDEMDILGAVIFEVYYSETDEWKKFKVALPGGPRLIRRLKMQDSGAVLGGILHWAEFELGVIVYDPEANPNRMRVIPRPWSPDRDGLLQLCLCLEYRGELRYIEGYLGRNLDFPSFCIWRRLEEEDCGISNGEWCFQHKIQSKDFFGSGIVDPMRSALMMESLFFDPCDSDVVYVVGLGCHTLRFVFSYNLKSGRLEQRPEMIVGDGPFSLQGDLLLPFTLSLVVPPWPTRVAEELLERR